MKLKTLTILAVLLFLAGSSTAQTGDGLDFRTQDPIDFYSDLNLQGNDIGSVSGLSGVNYQRFDNQDGDFIRVLGSGGASHTLRYDDRSLHFYNGNSGSVLNLTRSGNVQTFGNLNLQSNDIVAPNLVTTDGTGSDVIIVRDTSQGQDLARFYEGGNVSLPSGNVSLGNNLITDLAPPQTGEDAVRLSYLASNYVNKSGDTMYGTLNMNSNTISNIAQLTNYYSNPCAAGNAMVDLGDNGQISCVDATSMVSGDFVTRTGDTMSGNLRNTGGNIIAGDGNSLQVRPSDGSAWYDIYDDSGTFTIQQTGDQDALRITQNSHNVVIPSGNLNLAGNSITNFFSGPCASEKAVVDIADDGTISCIDVTNTVSDDFVTRTGDSMTGNLDMTGNRIQNIDRATFDGGEAMITTHDGHGNFNIKAGVDNGNNIVEGAGGSHIQMSDGGDISLLADTGTSEGGSFSTSAELEVAGNVEVKSANLNMNGNSITNYYGSPCSSEQAVADIQNNGVLNCVDVTNTVSDDFVSRSGDSMNGDLDMTGKDINQVSDLNTGGTQLNVGGDMTVSGTVTATGGLQTESGSVTSDKKMCLGDQCT